MRYPWSELKIEATTDLRLIKRTYAKLLKQCKPDENPEQFTALNHAYHEACLYARNQNHTAEPPIDTVQPVHTVHETPESIEIQPEPGPPPVYHYRSFFESRAEIHDDITEEANDVLDLNSIQQLFDDRNWQLSAWNAVLSNPKYILTMNSFEYVSRLILEEIVDIISSNRRWHSYQSDENGGDLTFEIINSPNGIITARSFVARYADTLLYFESIFSWTENWQTLVEVYDEDGSILELLNEIENVKTIAEQASKSFIARYAESLTLDAGILTSLNTRILRSLGFRFGSTAYRLMFAALSFSLPILFGLVFVVIVFIISDI